MGNGSEAIGVSAPAVPMGDDRPQLRASPIRERPTSGDGMLNRCSPCITPRVIPSRGDERSETPPCRGILASALTSLARIIQEHAISGRQPRHPERRNGVACAFRSRRDLTLRGPHAQRSESTMHPQARHVEVRMRLRREMLRLRPQHDGFFGQGVKDDVIAVGPESMSGLSCGHRPYGTGVVAQPRVRAC